MTTETISGDRIRAEILKVLSGFWQRLRETPKIYILSPWITDAQLEIDANVLTSDELWFGLDYGILSINLAHSVLLVKLVFGAEVNIVTHDPAREEKSRGRECMQRAYNLLEFLDEVGCRVFLTSNLHSTLILTNDLALSGSCDLLSKSEAYDENEKAMLINSLDETKALEKNAINAVNSSTPYGYTTRAAHLGSSIIAEATRGWLYEMIVEHYFPHSLSKRDSSYIFLTEQVGTKSVYFDGMIREIASDLETFYVKAFLKALSGENRSIERNFRFLPTLLGYRGKMEIEELMNFLEVKFARRRVPVIPLRMLSMPECFKKP